MLFAAFVKQKKRIKKGKTRPAGQKKAILPRFTAVTGLFAVLIAAGCTTLPARQDKPAGEGGGAAKTITAPALRAKNTARAKSSLALMQTGAVGRKAEMANIANKEARTYSRIGRASWYGSAFQGKRTANGEIFDMGNLTAAHRTMPLPSYARITNLKNGSSLIVRVNDRGPYAHNRLIDLSQRAAQLLGYHRGGLADVKVDYVGPAPAKADDKAYLRASYHAAKPAAAVPESRVKPSQKTVAAPGRPAAARANSSLSYREENSALLTGNKAEDSLSALVPGKMESETAPTPAIIAEMANLPAENFPAAEQKATFAARARLADKLQAGLSLPAGLGGKKDLMPDLLSYDSFAAATGTTPAAILAETTKLPE